MEKENINFSENFSLTVCSHLKTKEVNNIGFDDILIKNENNDNTTNREEDSK